MSEDTITEAELHAYADGRLTDERRAAVEAWLASRLEETERVAAYRRIGEELRAAYDPVLDEPVPGIFGRVLRPKPRWHALARVAAWVAVGIVVGAVAGWQLHEARPVVAA